MEVCQAINKTLATLVMIQVFSQPLEDAAMEKAGEFGVEMEVILVEGLEEVGWEEMGVVVEDLEEAAVVVGQGLEEMEGVAEVLEASEMAACE